MNLAFVLLSKPVMPKGADIARAFARLAAKTDHLRVGETKEEGQTDILELDLGPHGTAFVALMPVLVPQGEADGAAQCSLSALGMGWIPSFSSPPQPSRTSASACRRRSRPKERVWRVELP